MTLSNAFPNAPAREWAQSPVLKRRLDLQADYQKQAWDGERSHGFASWQPVVLSQNEIAKLDHKPKKEPKENPISDTPEAFQKANQPTDTGADASQQEGKPGDPVNDAGQAAEPDQADNGADLADAWSEPAGREQDEAKTAASQDQNDSPRQGEAPSLNSQTSADASDDASGTQQTAAGNEEGLTEDLALEQERAQRYTDGYEQGLVEGQDKGHAAGLAEGIEQGLAQAAQQQDAALDKAIAALTQAAADTTTLNDDPKQHFEPLKRLALHLAEELVRGELMLDSGAIERLIQAALEQLDNPSKRVRVALHPDDMAALSAQGKQLGAGVVMVADKAMLRGGVRVTSNDAVVQDLIDNRLGHLADALLIDKAQWLNSSEALQQGTAWATKASVLERMRATEDAAEVGVPAADTTSASPAAPEFSPALDEPGMSGIDRMSQADALDDDPSDYSLEATDLIAASDEVASDAAPADPMQADLMQADPVKEQAADDQAADAQAVDGAQADAAKQGASAQTKDDKSGDEASDHEPA